MIPVGKGGLGHRARVKGERRRCPHTRFPHSTQQSRQPASEDTSAHWHTPTVLQMLLRAAVGAKHFYNHEPNPCKTGDSTNTTKMLSYESEAALGLEPKEISTVTLTTSLSHNFLICTMVLLAPSKSLYENHMNM